jgi:hypothetical protein
MGVGGPVWNAFPASSTVETMLSSVTVWSRKRQFESLNMS